MALDIISQDELEWGLASQFDLSDASPEADTIDRGATALVSPEWTLAHLTLPNPSDREHRGHAHRGRGLAHEDGSGEMVPGPDRQGDRAGPGASARIREVWARAAAHEDEEKPEEEFV